MEHNPHISLTQWQALIAVVEHGGYAQAAEALHKSQSTITYAVQKLEALLDLQAFDIVGRKAVLTETGQLLYRRAKTLLNEASALELAAKQLAGGCEAEVRLAVDQIFPHDRLLAALQRFSIDYPHTRVQLIESVLGGAEEALLEGRVDMAITGRQPPGFLGDSLLQLRFIAVAHPDHPLHKLSRELDRELDYADLRQHRQLVVRDTATRQQRDSGWLGAEQRWTVSQIATSVRAISQGMGFAWLPEPQIKDQLAAGSLLPLPLREGRERLAELFLIYADRDAAGPATLQLGALLAQSCSPAATGVDRQPS